MADAHVPLLTSLQISEEEQAALEQALTTDKPWDHDGMPAIKDHLRSVKEKLCDLHMQRQDGMCCYCRTRLEEYGPYVRDREHILPKESFKSLTYTPYNISVSCKRCNMEIKKTKVDFVVDLGSILDAPRDPNRYRIVHPNFDKWDDHLTCFRYQSAGLYVCFYNYKDNGKGRYTYDYFELKSLCTDHLNQAQGLKVVSSLIQESLHQLSIQYDQEVTSP